MNHPTRLLYPTNQLCLLCLFSLLCLACTGCTPRPENVSDALRPAPIYPDYADVTIPPNIAPLNFLLREEADALEVTVSGRDDSLVVRGRREACFPLRKWKKLLAGEAGRSLTVRVTARTPQGWLRYPAFTWQVAPEKIDGYLSYRSIEPGYEVWNAIRLCERSLETFEERVIADNNLTDGSCMNCHIYGNHSGHLSLFHLRGEQGGTILNRGGALRKLALKTDSMVSAAVYGDLHPSGRYGVFSSNLIIPAFHAEGNRRLEVYDTASDLAVADFDSGRMIVSPLTARTTVFETFPAFSADGRWIYYCAAPAVALPDSLSRLRYSLCRIAFDPEKGAWGNRIDTLWDASAHKASACFPKASPDGRYLLYSVADYGTFPIWHRETDLCLMDLQTGLIDSLPTVNSDRSDTYHSWSSDSRWFVFASKRGDGQYGKPYVAYVGPDGKVGKPFVLPQKEPSHYDYTLKSYNIPELSATPVPFDAADIRKVWLEKPAEVFK